MIGVSPYMQPFSCVQKVCTVHVFLYTNEMRSVNHCIAMTCIKLWPVMPVLSGFDLPLNEVHPLVRKKIFNSDCEFFLESSVNY